MGPRCGCAGSARLGQPSVPPRVGEAGHPLRLLGGCPPHGRLRRSLHSVQVTAVSCREGVFRLSPWVCGTRAPWNLWCLGLYSWGDGAPTGRLLQIRTGDPPSMGKVGDM